MIRSYYMAAQTKIQYFLDFINQNKPSVATIDIWGIFLKPSNIGFPL